MSEASLAAAATCFSQGKFTEAAALYSDLINEGSADAKVYSNRSACYTKLGKFDEALKDAVQAVQLDAKFAKGYGRQAAALQGLKRYEEGVQAYRSALLLDPTNGTYREGLQELETLIAKGGGIASQATMDQYYLEKSLTGGREAMAAGKFLEAIRHYTKALGLAKKDDQPVLLCNRSAAYFKCGGKLEESLQDAEQALQLDPTYARAAFRAATALFQLQKLTEAKSMVERSLKLDPASVTALELKEQIVKEERVKAMTAVEAAAALRAQAAEADARNLSSAAATRTTGGTYGGGGGAHATTYLHCTYCNAFGHTRASCLLLSRKRARD